MASLETTVGYVAVNFTVAHLRLEPVNASSRWDGSPAAEGAELEEQQRLIGEQAYRDFSTTIQVFILLTSLLCKSNTHQRPQKRADLFYKRPVVRKYKRKRDQLSSLFTYKPIHKNMFVLQQCAGLSYQNYGNEMVRI